MTYQIKCPTCYKHLYFPSFDDQEDVLVSICTGCRYKYALQQREVESFISNVEAKPSATSTKTVSYRRVYNLRLQQTNGTFKSLTFSTPGQSEKTSGSTGDTILLLYTMRGKELEDLVWIENLTTQKSHLLLNPKAKTRSTGFATAALFLVGSSLLAGFLQISTNQLFWATATTSSIGVGVYVSKRSSLKVRDCVELGRLLEQQKMLAQKHELEQKTTSLIQELQVNRKLIQRLTKLQSKMISLGEDVYSTQIVTVTKGINILEEQLNLLQNLIDGYSQLIKVIDIKFETSHLVEQLPEDITEEILGRLEELKVIHAKKEELSLLVNPQQLLAEFYPKQS